VVKRFDTKGGAIEGGVLKRAVGPDGGSVKIQKANGRFQEERTYPRSRDPVNRRDRCRENDAYPQVLPPSIAGP
jgi:hypothetical protein